MEEEYDSQFHLLIDIDDPDDHSNSYLKEYRNSNMWAQFDSMIQSIIKRNRLNCLESEGIDHMKMSTTELPILFSFISE